LVDIDFAARTATLARRDVHNHSVDHHVSHSTSSRGMRGGCPAHHHDLLAMRESQIMWSHSRTREAMILAWGAKARGGMRHPESIFSGR
jgi:hypothetical protein